MKIGIEGQRLFREKKHGMDMVALELIKELQLLDKKNEYVIFVKPDVDKTCLQETENFKIVELSGGPYPTWEQFALPKAAHKENCDILHCTSNTAPYRIKMPLIVTLHDIIYMEKTYAGIVSDKGTTYQKFGNVYRRWFVPRIVKSCDVLITVSNFEKKRISDFFKLKDDRLHAVYNGVSEHFRKITDTSELDRVKKQYNLPEKYFFFLGNTDPKKNTKGVLKAYSEYRKQATEDFKLLMLDYDEEELMKLLDEIGDRALREHIKLTGYVVNTDLPAIYSLCDIFLYPSLRESFGIPMLEAMRCATPVITSNTSSMPEVSGDGAFIIDPYKPEEITGAIFKIQSDDKLRQSLVEKGLKRSEFFSWKNMAKTVLGLYEQIYANHKAN